MAVQKTKARYQNYIYLDVETGGLDPNKHALTQFACIIYDGLTLSEIVRYKTYVNNCHSLEITEKAASVTGITQKDIDSGIPEKELVSNLIELFKTGRVSGHKAYRPIMVAHNANFDMNWMDVVFKRNKEDFFKHIDEIPFCTMKLDKASVLNDDGEIKYSLDNCCDRLGIELIDGHDALNDVVAGGNLFINYMNKLRGEGGVAYIEKGSVRDREGYLFEI